MSNLKTKLGVSAILAASLPFSASAIVLEIDAFNQGNFTIEDSTADGMAETTGAQNYITADGYGITRTITMNLNNRDDDDMAKVARARVFDGTFSISNDVGVDSTTELSYDISSLSDPLSGGTDGFLQISVLNADVSRTLDLFLNGDLQSTFTSDDIITSSDNFVRLLPFDISSLTGMDNLTLRVTGGESLDYRLSLLAISNTDVPEPGAIALFGLGLAGLGIVHLRRRRGQNPEA